MLEKNNTTRVLELFFDYPTSSFHIREIARMLKISAPTASAVINKLEKERLIIRRKTKVIDEVKADMESEMFKAKKRSYNLDNIYESGLIEHLKKDNPSAIVLFGSYSKGEDIEKSDIDIAVIGKVNMPEIEDFEKRLKRRINLHIIALSEASKEFKNSLANGIVLHGYLK